MQSFLDLKQMTSRINYVCMLDGKEVDGSIDSSEPRVAPINAHDVNSVYAAVRGTTSSSSDVKVECSKIERDKPKQSAKEMEWISRRMTPSCKQYAWNPSQVISYDQYECRYLGEGLIPGPDGKEMKVSNPFKTWTGTLASCATGTAEDMSISDETYEAIQKHGAVVNMSS